MIWSLFFMLILTAASAFFYSRAEEAERENANLRRELEGKERWDGKRSWNDPSFRGDNK